MSDDAHTRIAILKVLAEEYFHLERGVLIERHTFAHRILVIENKRHTNHPHAGHEVRITRKALKHFVESRKEEMEKHHNLSDTLSNILFAVEHIRDAIVDFDRYELEPPDKHFYSKDYSSLGKPNLRILVEVRDSCLNIVSIHFRKHGRK